METDRVAWALAVPLSARIRLIRWIRGFIDSTASVSQSITTASRNAVNREPGSLHRVVARTGPVTLRTARLAAVLDEDLDRAGRDDGCRCEITLTKA
jgi:hypothetical protein